jgi:hypothetical protein
VSPVCIYVHVLRESLRSGAVSNKTSSFISRQAEELFT